MKRCKYYSEKWCPNESYGFLDAMGNERFCGLLPNPFGCFKLRKAS